VVPDAQLADAAKPYLDEMLTTSPIGLRLTKEGLNMAIDATSLDAAMAIENRNQILCSQSEDFREAIRAFGEKRAPVFSGR
jgi:enoyl-CoA hydratase